MTILSNFRHAFSFLGLLLKHSLMCTVSMINYVCRSYTMAVLEAVFTKILFTIWV